MKETGNIIAIQEETAVVAFERSSACASCGACSRGGGKEMLHTLPNTLNGAIGDKVVVELQSKYLLRAGFWVYLFPLFMIFAGIGAGYLLAPLFGVPVDIFAALVSLVFAGGSYFILRLLDKRFAKQKGYHLVMCDIIRQNEQKENGCNVECS